MTGVLAYIERMIPVMFAALPVWAALRGIFLILKKQRLYWKQELLMTAFVVWCASLASQTILPSNGYFIPWSSVGSWRTAMRINLVPFRTILQYFTRGNITLLLVNFVGNIVVFIPLGLFPPLLWPRWRTWRGVLLPALCSLCVEFMQIFTGRSVVVADLILNALGGFLGWLMAQALQRLRMKKRTRG